MQFIKTVKLRLFEFLLKVLIRSSWSKTVSVTRVRKRVALLDKFYRSRPKNAQVSCVQANGVPCSWVVSEHAGVSTDRVLLYLHGGGFSLHMPHLYTSFAADLSRRLGARVLLVDYRLAPEHPFPAAPQDCLEAYRWLLQQPGVDAAKLMIAGDSAGGNLALVTMLMAKAEGLPLPSAAWAISPGVDCNWSHSSLQALQEKDPMFNAHAVEMMNPYFGDADREDYRISPINGDLQGLPPILLDAGSEEIFTEHPAMFAERARAVGVMAEDRIWPGLPHVFPLFSIIPQANDARQVACGFLLGHVGDLASEDSAGQPSAA